MMHPAVLTAPYMASLSGTTVYHTGMQYVRTVERNFPVQRGRSVGWLWDILWQEDTEEFKGPHTLYTLSINTE